MCLILLAWQADPRYRLVVAANRDEVHSRPSAGADWWPDVPGLFAGRDRVGGGTWLGMTRDGRFAALTNHRDRRRPPGGQESRGALVREFLAGDLAPLEYLEKVEAQRSRWPAFNLLVGTSDTLACLATEAPDGARIQCVAPGMHGLSNALFDTPWPKVRRGMAALDSALLAPDPGPALFDALADRSEAVDAELPDTGLPRDRERAVSAAMIVDPVYGTRCSTVLLVDRSGGWSFVERSFTPAGKLDGVRVARMDTPSSASGRELRPQ